MFHNFLRDHVMWVYHNTICIHVTHTQVRRVLIILCYTEKVGYML